MLTKFQRNQILSLIQDERFRAVEAFMKILKEKYQVEQVKADDQFNTTWRTAQKEAKMEAIDNFINGLVEEASKND